MEFSVACSACAEVSFLERLIGLDRGGVEAWKWRSQESSQGAPGEMNNRTEVNFVVEEVVLVSSGISIIVDHPASASSHSGPRQVSLDIAAGASRKHLQIPNLKVASWDWGRPYTFCPT